MLKIDKVNPPHFFEDCISKEKPQNWEQFTEIVDRNGIKINRRLRKYILNREQQLFHKKYFCSYCEREIILNNSHIDHIKPKGRPEYKSFEFDYDNFTASCSDNYTCGMFKQSKYASNAIHPVEDNPDNFIGYSADGKIEAKKESTRVVATINLYNLENSILVEARKNVILNLNNYGEQLQDFIDEIQKEFQFPSLVKWFKEVHMASKKITP